MANFIHSLCLTGLVLVLASGEDGGTGETLPWVVWSKTISSSKDQSDFVEALTFTAYMIGDNPTSLCRYNYVGPKEIKVLQEPRCLNAVSSFRKSLRSTEFFASPIDCLVGSEGASSFFETPVCNFASTDYRKTIVRLEISDATRFVQCNGYFKSGRNGDVHKCHQTPMKLRPQWPFFHFSQEKETLLLTRSKSIAVNETTTNASEADEAIKITSNAHVDEEPMETTTSAPEDEEPMEFTTSATGDEEPIETSSKVPLISRAPDEESYSLSVPELIILVPLVILVFLMLCFLLGFVIYSHFYSRKVYDENSV